MQPVERNPKFTNPLIHSASPYLRQHAHNPVYWYPWGEEALSRARAENKPILLSVGYSTCHWCHVMEREVFENLSIASLMNKHFINVKVDREEHPAIDEFGMVARQLMTHEGGWPNNVFLTPDLHPFYAGGTYAPDEAYGKPAFPRLLEWLHYAWTTQESEVRGKAAEILNVMRPFLVYAPQESGPKLEDQPQKLFVLMRDNHDARSGGFFQAPKFPHECYLDFLLRYPDKAARDMAVFSLRKMAAGGIYDHVGCGFHRYAVDKEWYVPHFEKMLYNQALLARAYTDAAALTDNPYLADIARSILDFVGGPLTDGGGAFYAAIDADTDGVEGAYYAWNSAEIEKLLTPEEVKFLTAFYALADIPAFPGHKHPDGQVIVARKPLDEAGMDYLPLAAMAGQVMNKMLVARNQRKAPHLDDKIITGWNGLMIDAFAHAAKVFGQPKYLEAARRAAWYLLDHALDNEGRLCRVISKGQARLAATLEDYAFMARGLLSLHRASPDDGILQAAVALMERAEEIFSDPAAPGYFMTEAGGDLPIRIKSGEDSAVPSANAVMLHDFIDLAELTGEEKYREKARALAGHFLGGNPRAMVEYAAMAAGALRLNHPSPQRGEVGRGASDARSLASHPHLSPPPMGEGIISATASLSPPDAKPGDECQLRLTLEIADGWRINAASVDAPHLIPTQLDVQGKGVKVHGIDWPAAGNGYYEGRVAVTVRLKLTGKGKKRPGIRVLLRFQPCRDGACEKQRDIVITL